MGGRGGGRSRSKPSTARTRRAARMAAKKGIGTGVRAAHARGERGFSAFGGKYSGGNVGVAGTDAYNAATPAQRAAAQENMRNWNSYQAGNLTKSQIPGTAEYAQRIRKEEAKEKTTKAESGFGDTFKKALAAFSFVAAPGIATGLNLANTLKKKDTDYSKAFAPQSLADKYGAWSPQNLSRFYGATTDPGDWNLAMDNTVNPDLPGAGFGMSQELRKIQKAISDTNTPKDALPGLQRRMFQLQNPGLDLASTVSWTAPSSYNVAEVSDTSDVKRDWFGEGSINEGEYGVDRTMDTLEGLGLGIERASADWGMGSELGQVAYAGNYGLGIGQNEVGQVTRSNDPIAQQNRDNLNQISARLASSDTPGMDKLNRSWSRGLGTDTRAVRSATVRSRGGGARPLPTLASQAPALKAAQDQQAQAGNLTITDYLKQAQNQSAQNRTALSQLQTGRTDLTAQIEALKKQYGEDVDLTGLQKQSGEFQTAIDKRTADLSAYDQAVRGNVVRQQQMWATPQRTWGVKARTSEYKSPLQQFGRKARQETKKIQTQTPTISNLAATWGNLPVLNV